MMIAWHILSEADPASIPYEKLSLVGVLVLAIVAFMRRWVVPGVFYEDLKKENARLVEENHQLRTLGQAATGVAETIAKKSAPRKPSEGERG